jgi:hypothetical protein
LLIQQHPSPGTGKLNESAANSGAMVFAAPWKLDRQPPKLSDTPMVAGGACGKK